MNYRKGFGLLLSIAFIFLVASLSNSAEFSADMTIQSATGGDLTGRVFVKGNDLRQELDTPVETQTTIIDQTRKVMYVLLPDQKMYMEMPNNQVTLDEGERMEEKFADQGEVTNLGTETVEGYPCDIFRIVYKDKGLGELTVWVSRDLNYPVKIYMNNPQDKATILYTNFSEEKLEDSLFLIPGGYQKFSI